MITIPTIEQALRNVVVPEKLVFIQEMYPISYGYKFLTAHPNVVPPQVMAVAAKDYEESGFPLGSPQMTGNLEAFYAHVVWLWSSMAGEETSTALLTVLADAYLVKHGIEKPE